MNEEISNSVKLLIEKTIVDNGFILSDVIYEKEDNNYFLRIIIDKNGIIDIEDCVKVTHLIDPLLDKCDILKESYILDVCSEEKGCDNGE